MWNVNYSNIESWLDGLDKETVASIFDSLRLLEEQGPNLGRPLVDTLKHTTYKNFKELRPASPHQQEIRIIFVFDPKRQAILLLGGDKAKGKNKKLKWANWYKIAIPKAEFIYKRHLKKLGEKDE